MSIDEKAFNKAIDVVADRLFGSQDITIAMLKSLCEAYEDAKESGEPAADTKATLEGWFVPEEGPPPGETWARCACRTAFEAWWDARDESPRFKPMAWGAWNAALEYLCR